MSTNLSFFIWSFPAILDDIPRCHLIERIALNSPDLHGRRGFTSDLHMAVRHVLKSLVPPHPFSMVSPNALPKLLVVLAPVCVVDVSGIDDDIELQNSFDGWCCFHPSYAQSDNLCWTRSSGNMTMRGQGTTRLLLRHKAKRCFYFHTTSGKKDQTSVYRDVPMPNPGKIYSSSVETLREPGFWNCLSEFREWTRYCLNISIY